MKKTLLMFQLYQYIELEAKIMLQMSLYMFHR